MRILITGASGFLGRRLADVLYSEGHQPVAVTRSSFVSADIKTYRLDDALDARSYERIIAEHGIEAVINTLAAGVDPTDRVISSLIRANAVFPSELALVAKEAGANLFIQIGSSAEYAAQPLSRPFREDDALMQDKVYGATKAAGSIMLAATATEAGLSYAVLRLFNIFGAGEKAYRLFPSLVRRLQMGEEVPLSEGVQIRDFLHVDDACRAISRTVTELDKAPAASGIYNLASGEGLSVRDFALSVAKTVGAAQNLLRFGVLPMRPDDLPYVVADTSKLSALIGSGEQTSMSEAVAPFMANRHCEVL